MPVVLNPTPLRACEPVARRVAGALPATYDVWLAGSLVSQLGDAALYFALGWAASAIGGSAAGLVLSAIVLSRTVLLLLGGVVGDRAGARRVMITGDAVCWSCPSSWARWPTAGGLR